MSDKLSATEAKLRRHVLDKNERLQEIEKQDERAEKRREEVLELERKLIDANEQLAKLSQKGGATL